MKTYFLLASLAFSTTVAAQDKKTWNINTPDAPGKTVSFTVSEGTWMNLDVSPDGKTIVFDLLGDIYSIPVSGGTAKALRTGMPMEVQPRFSPDGKHILFTSDAGGGDNVWVMRNDGSDARQITKETFRLLNNGVWSPDGQYIIARKHFTSTRSLGAGEIWIYHISGGDGMQLVPKRNEQQDINEPSASADGYIYYSEDMYPGGGFEYNKDPNKQIFAIKRFNREKGEIENVTGGPGGAVRPQVSPDGSMLAFVRRVREKTVLFIRNIKTGEEWPVYEKLSKDQQEAWTIFGSYTNFAWLPGNKEVIIWANGKLNRIHIDKPNEAVNIPFTVTSSHRITDAVRFEQQIDPAEFDVKVIRHASTSPDGKTLLFSALGAIYIKALPEGKPRRITGNDSSFEYEPSFSPDGKQVVYVTWNDSLAGGIYIADANGKGQPKKLNASKGMFREPSFSPDAKTIVYRREAGNGLAGAGFTSKPGIYTMPSAGGEETFVMAKGAKPVFSANGERIYYQSGGYVPNQQNKSFGWVKTDGSDDRQIFKSAYGGQFTVSPDGNWVAFTDLHEVYIAAFPGVGKTVEVGSGMKSFPVKRVSKNAGVNLHWSSDSKKLHYTLGDQYYTISLEDRFEFVANKPDSLFKYPEKGIAVGLKAKTDKPTGRVAFTNARIITMEGNEVIEGGTVLVNGNKIEAVGRNVEVPRGTKIIDATGKTIMPGMIDAHAHGSHFHTGLIPQNLWPYYVNLAYGVTTMHDPSANTETVFGQSEMVKAGKIAGPRVFSTGTILYGADGDFKTVINNLDDARSAVRRAKAWGAFSIKSYNQPRREQRQMLIQAAKEEGIEVVPEGGSFFFHNLSMILDGHTTIEHNMPIHVLYNDVVNLWKNSATAYTPTLVVSYGSMSGQAYFWQSSNVWEKERLMAFTPRSVIDPQARHRVMIPDEEYHNGHILTSKSAKKLTDEGVKVNMGAHGELQGLGAHWETWMMAQGGMTPHEALRTATINPAQSLGFGNSLGSIKAGKLADLLVLSSNPLDDIRNTESIEYTMVNGRLFNAATMNEEGNHPRPRGKFYWEQVRNAEHFEWHMEGEAHGCDAH